jgi:WD40 repeat protein/serine/threonine protein kinase
MPLTQKQEEALFRAAVELSAGNLRQAFLDQACAGDAALRQRLQALLAEHEQPDTVLTRQLEAARLTIKLDLADAPDEAVGLTLGRYKLLERVGEGGCGVVYVAEQNEPVRRRVALKVIKLGMDTKQVVARFEAERQALAMMDHPNIAKVLDAGTTDLGRPYFVMELVRGIRITDYCDQANLSTTDRLDLFVKVCQAIQHAHQKGIIHRDIKPSNILVTLNDGVAVPKVIDFGIAKATEGRLTDNTVYTQLHQFIGTPAYMSPEQAEMTSLDIDTRSDVYSLGVLLYELLVGSTPFDAKELMSQGIDAMRKTIREREPPRPSTRLATLGADQLTTAARRRSADTPKLLRQLKGDLDWIVMKCLEKDRQRRYDTATGLAADLRRHLTNEPVTARPPSAAYRLQKAWRRNQLAFTAAVAMAAMLFIGITISSWQAIEASKAKDAERQQRLTAQAERDKAQTAQIQLARNVRDLEWQKLEELILSGERGEALAYLSRFLRESPRDQAAATRVVAMMSGCNFVLPAGAPLQHGAIVNSVSLSADNQHVVTAANDGKARLWNVRDGRLIATFPHPRRVDDVVFAADERYILTTCQDGVVRLWDSVESVPVFEFTQSAAPGPRDNHCIITPDRRRIAVVEPNGFLQVWDVLGRVRVGPAHRTQSKVGCVAFSPNGNRLAIGLEGGKLVVLQADLAEPLAVFPEPIHATVLTFSPDGQTLAISSAGDVILWEAPGSQRFLRQGGHLVMLVQFAPDGKRIVVSAFNEPIRIYTANSGQPLGAPIPAEGPFPYFRLSPDGTSLVSRSQNGVARMWSAFTGEALSEPFEHRGTISDVAFGSDGHSLFTASQDGTAQAWNVQVPKEDDLLCRTQDAHPAATFSPTGDRVFLSKGQEPDEKGEAIIVDSRTGRQMGETMVHLGQVFRLAASADGKLLAAVGGSQGYIWDAHSGKRLAPPLVHRGGINEIAFSPDNRLVATASGDSTARVWDASTGQPIGRELVHNQQVLCVRFSPDSRAVVTASQDTTAQLWSATTGEPLWPEPIRHQGIVWTAEFSPDGSRIVTASTDRSAMVWDAKSRQPITQPMRHERSVFGAHFSPDGARVLTYSEDGTARVWDATTGAPVSRPMRHRDKIWTAQFSPDGRMVVTGADDNTARLWDAQTGYPIGEPVLHTNQVTAVEFTRDGQRFLSISKFGCVRIRAAAMAPVPVPPWFCDLVEAVAGKRLNANGDAEPLSLGSVLLLSEKLASIKEADFYSNFAKWLLYERFKAPAPKTIPQ